MRSISCVTPGSALGSPEEVEDIKNAYILTGGSIGEVMTYIPHSTHHDEARFIILISDLISEGNLPALPAWESSIKDEKSRLVRKKQGEREEKEAEVLAKELGVWDEFYGSGKPSERKSKGKGQGRKGGDGDEDGGEDVSVLQALILKRKKNTDGFFDDLAAKYGQQPAKKSRGPPAPPEIDDAEFEKLQQQLFGDKSKTSNGAPEASNKKAKKGRKVK
jgi:DnaJ family protein C protein 9